MSSSNEHESVARRLERWQRALIDLTRRNRLLNYRPTKRSTIEVVDELPDRIFVQLASNATFEFDPRPEVPEDGSSRPAGTAGASQRRLDLGRDLVPVDGDDLPEHHRDERLQTRLDEKRLDAVLTAIYRKAEESVEEQGVNTLFLALGMLEWYESPDSDVANLAPLLMVPVRLDRKTAASPFVLSRTEDDPFLNPAIVEKLRVDFQIQLPDLPELGEELDVRQVFEGIASAIVEMPAWRLTADIVLGLFGFQKFIMYRDLQRNSEAIKRHRIVRRISGQRDDGPGDGPPIPDAGTDLEDATGPWTTTQVLDADSSQQRAMLAVREGQDLVIEGPPGTGKSQTITNLVADAIAEGRRVLFVSEKMAALEVVKTRIESVGLGDYCLELHSNKASKRAFVESLALSLDREPHARPEIASSMDRLRELTGELRSYVLAAHEPHPRLDVSPFRAIAQLAELDAAPDVDADVPEPLGVDAEGFRRACLAVADLAGILTTLGDPETHPLRGFGLENAGRRERDEVRSAVDEAAARFRRLADAWHAVSNEAGLASPRTFGEVRDLLACARVVRRSPGVETDILEGDAWNEISAEAKEILETGRRFAAGFGEVRGRFRLQVLDTDLAGDVATYERLVATGARRWFVPAYWRSRSRLRSQLASGHRPQDARGLLDECRTAVDCRRDLLRLRELNASGRALFGARWRREKSDWDDLERFSRWIVEFRRYAVRNMVERRGFDLASVTEREEVVDEAAIEELENAMTAFDEAVERLRDVGRMSDEAGVSCAAGTAVATVGRRLAEISDALDGLRLFSQYRAARRACEEGPACDYVQAVLATDVAPDDLEPGFRKVFLERWIDAIVRERPVLESFRTERHEAIVAEFRDLDRRSFEIARERARAGLDARRQDLLRGADADQLQIVQREARKKRRIRPIRTLLGLAPRAVQMLKPCFMMSPLSVAQFLDLEKIDFDVVIFDEASQITPPDAIGAIVRAAQTVVVGDSRQLPPTDFFNSQIDEPGDDGEMQDLADLESILDEVATARVLRTRLKWHYRSRHESLIRFSNEEFYSDEPLYVFPSPYLRGGDLGLHFELVPGGVYEGNGENPTEARHVAEAVARHIREHPDLSLGVGTFGVAQQGRILDELDAIRRDDPTLEWFFARTGEVKFFVKNLENIQGDDRDVIFLSVTYGPDAHGTVRRNFGPINRDGGWRRLNVLTTRAKSRLRVFSSMRGDQIAMTDVASGAVLLRKFLQYAESGEYPAPRISVGEPESPFERAVADEVRRLGYEVVTQVGDGGYRIDIGVLHPDAPGRYLCGIECDGASYHSAATTRDRDRLRQQVLEDRKWIIHRVWSTDWFQDRRSQVERIARLLRVTEERPVSSVAVQDDEPDELRLAPPPEGGTGHEEAPVPEIHEIAVADYVLADIPTRGSADDFYVAPSQEIYEVIRSVVAAEAPIHLDEIVRRVAGAWGLRRAGHHVVGRVRAAFDAYRTTDEFVVDGPFVWPADLDPIPVRSRAVDGLQIDASLIAPVEAEEAIRILLRHRAPLMQDDVVIETARLLGYRRTGTKLRRLIRDALATLIDRRELRPAAQGIVMAEAKRDSTP